jgi:hypothetical protein
LKPGERRPLVPTKEKARSGSSIEDVKGDTPKATGEQQQPAGGQAPAPTPTVPARKPPPLPSAKTSGEVALAQKLTVIYGPEGVGKSTLASQWAGGEVFFFNTAGELGGLEVYQQPVSSWEQFREYAWSLAESPDQFDAWAIDTGDLLGKYCAEKIRKKLGIAHESDLDWGKGWSALRDEWQLNLAKLVALPMGGIIVAHSTEVEVSTKTQKWNKTTLRGVKGIRETTMEMADLVLYVDFSEQDDDQRVIKTKPSRYWAAKERGQTPRLPAEVEWPLGTNGFDILQTAYEKGAK